jgi:hypothetical protein
MSYTRSRVLDTARDTMRALIWDPRQSRESSSRRTGPPGASVQLHRLSRIPVRSSLSMTEYLDHGKKILDETVVEEHVDDASTEPGFLRTAAPTTSLMRWSLPQGTCRGVVPHRL